MFHKGQWSEEEIKGGFESLGLNDSTRDKTPQPPKPQEANPAPPSAPKYPRLSDSSVPLPTGRPTDAELEAARRRDSDGW